MSDTDLLGKMVTDITQTMSKIQDAQTFNSLLAHEVMGLRSTEHFQHVDSHWTADGVMVIYKCSMDGRTYNVHITAEKGS